MPKSLFPADERMARRAGYASFIGTTIEWYDFYLFGLASALVFGPLFFSNAPPEVGLLLSFATFWTGFLARPIGGLVFGHLGDRIGRRRALITTLLMMGGTTAAIGLLPPYAAVGWWAPAALIVLRLIQGLAVGGEWGGAVLIATEHAERRRGIVFAAFAQQGSPAGQILSSVAFVLVSRLEAPAFLSWGWRIPFLASAVLVIVGLAIRLRVTESPAFARLQAAHQVTRHPITDVLRNHLGLVTIGICAGALSIAAVYLKNTFALSWATSHLGFSNSAFLTILTISSVVQFFVQPLGPWIASRRDPRRTVTALLLGELFALPVMFALLGTRDYGWALFGMVIVTIPQVMYYGILAGLLANAFPTNVRYTAISTSYQLTGAIFGTTPLIGAVLVTATDSIVPVIAFGMGTVLLSLFGARRLASGVFAAPPPDPADDPPPGAPIATSDQAVRP